MATIEWHHSDYSGDRLYTLKRSPYYDGRVIYDRHHRKWRVDTDLTPNKADWVKGKMFFPTKGEAKAYLLTVVTLEG